MEFDDDKFGHTESDRQLVLKLALDLHRSTGPGTRSAEQVILTAMRFLRFIQDPEKAVGDATIVKAARRAVQALYRVGNHSLTEKGERAIALATANELNTVLKSSSGEDEPTHITKALGG